MKLNFKFFGKSIKFGEQIDMFVEGSTKEFGEDDTRKLERTDSGKLRWKAANKKEKITNKNDHKKMPVVQDHGAYQLISSGGFPVMIGQPPIKKENRHGLKPGDKITQIGDDYVSKRTGEETYSVISRKDEFDNPIIYEGTLQWEDKTWLSFEYKEDGEKYHLIYIDAKEELHLPNYAKNELRIYKPKFKKQKNEPKRGTDSGKLRWKNADDKGEKKKEFKVPTFGVANNPDFKMPKDKNKMFEGISTVKQLVENFLDGRFAGKNQDALIADFATYKYSHLSEDEQFEKVMSIIKNFDEYKRRISKDREKPKVGKEDKKTAAQLIIQDSTKTLPEKQKKLRELGYSTLDAAILSVGLEPGAKADKAKILERKADKLADESMKMLEGVPPGQPVMSTRDRNLRDRARDKMERAGDLYKEAEQIRERQKAEKQPHEMTLDEFRDTHSPTDVNRRQFTYNEAINLADINNLESGKKYRKESETLHKIIISNALNDGKKVPAEVLADYPELGKDNFEKEIKEIEKPTNMGEGLRNFYQMIINEVAKGDLREADYLLSDLIDDLDSKASPYYFITEDWIKHTERIKDYVGEGKRKDAINYLKTLRDSSVSSFNKYIDADKSREAIPNAKEVADTIKNQIGNKALYMLGAKNILYDKDGSLSFRIQGSPKANYIKVRYNQGSDDYSMTFGKIRGNTYKEVKTVDGLYFDQLNKTIEENTGLYTSLGTLGRSQFMNLFKTQLNMFGGNDQQLGMFGNQAYEKEGTTKQGKGGTLVLKRDQSGKGAHWRLQDKKEAAAKNNKGETPEPAAKQPATSKIINTQKAYSALSNMIGHKATVMDKNGNLLGEGKFLVANERNSGGLSLLIQDEKGDSEFIPVGKDQAVTQTGNGLNFSFKDKTITISTNELAKVDTPKQKMQKTQDPERVAEWNRMANEYIRNAEAQKDQFLKDLDDVSVLNNLEPISHTYRKHAVKSKDSILNKFERNESTGKAHKNKDLSDTLRGTIKISNPNQYKDILESLKSKGYQVWKNDFTNLYDDEKPGYKHIAMKLVKGDSDPVVKELLLLTPAMYHAKHGFRHDVYDVSKNIQIALGDKIPKGSKAYKLVEQFDEVMNKVTNDFYERAYLEDKKSFSPGTSSGERSPSRAALTVAEPPVKKPSASSRKESSDFSKPSKRLIRLMRSSLKATWQPILASAVAFSGGNPNLSTSSSNMVSNLSNIVNPTIDIMNKFASNIINLRKSKTYKKDKIKLFGKVVGF